jgi:hypothetical protein
MKPDQLFLLAGLVALAGSFKQHGGFPDNGTSIIAGTAGLAFLASMSRNTKFDKPVMAFGGLTLLVAIYVWIPGLTKQKKGKANG